VLPAPGEEAAWEGAEEAEAAVPPIEIGRVSLFVA
jgi:hypothetical protein